jgi:hypothetical protein
LEEQIDWEGGYKIGEVMRGRGRKGTEERRV